MSEDIRSFIVKAIEKKSALPLGEDVDTFDYIDSGYIDSIGIIKFVLELEREFEIDIDPEDIESAEFRTVGGLVALIEQKLSRR